VSTVDFFTPIVDDAFDFGRIAAANAISDVYAMGGRPVFANAILGWPVDKLPLPLAAKVIDGAQNICAKAGIPLAGGHSIDSAEPIFGLAVNGLIRKEHIKRNGGAQEGDLIFITKPLGTGIVATAIKRGLLQHEEHKRIVVESMCALNTVGEKLSKLEGVHAMTDITGFGLLGHLIEMCEGSGMSAEIEMSKVPVFDFIDHYLQQNIIPDNTYRNWNSFEKKVNGISDMRSFQLLNDPQTSGGLMVAVAQESVAEVKAVLAAFELQSFVEPIGKFSKQTHAIIMVK
jgi:selenide,water dikinase